MNTATYSDKQMINIINYEEEAHRFIKAYFYMYNAVHNHPLNKQESLNIPLATPYILSIDNSCNFSIINAVSNSVEGSSVNCDSTRALSSVGYLLSMYLKLLEK